MTASEQKRAPTFDDFLRARGFDAKAPGAFLRRMFLTSWGEPGFHAFWRMWNPLYGYILFRLYLVLGGRRRPALASLIVFLACGFFLHDLVVAVSARRLSFTTTIAFGVFWLLATANRALVGRLRQERWRRSANVAANVACVAVGLAAGALLSQLFA